MHNPEQEILQRFSFFTYQSPALRGDDVIMPPARLSSFFLGLDTIIT